ncbi:hypothetical protein L1987_15013 [Smallanthus sonchifolius]|uniref:Uncharacterized protein n=1 Tax=Smallanthus sonchifolius TaxID=185202 RepID=A0ACB9J4F2_9ASTR|nr:hypothetical protein L1987_15013 [Smallanthus sonchifolius]
MEVGDFSWYHALPKAPIKEEYESDHLSHMGGSDLSNLRCTPPHYHVPPPPNYSPPQNPPPPIYPPPTNQHEAGSNRKAFKPRMRVREPVEMLSITESSLEEIYKNLEKYESSESEGFLPLPPVEAYSSQSASFEPFADYLNYLIVPGPYMSNNSDTDGNYANTSSMNQEASSGSYVDYINHTQISDP